MDSIIKFLRNNYAALLIGAIMYFLYLQFTISGNRICDCESTERVAASSTRVYRSGINRYYHK